MGTYLQIASQDTNVSFTDVNVTNNVTSNEVNTTIINATQITSSYATFGLAAGTFSGSFIGTISGSVDLDFVTPFYVTASAGYLSYTDNGVFTLINTGSAPSHFFLIQDATSDIFKINTQGVVQTKLFTTASSPTAQYGAFYFSNDDLYIGVET